MSIEKKQATSKKWFRNTRLLAHDSLAVVVYFIAESIPVDSL
jgi:hypothetical protein